jgi:hypothetical protein
MISSLFLALGPEHKNTKKRPLSVLFSVVGSSLP